jgi:hypothetical protein
MCYGIYLTSWNRSIRDEDGPIVAKAFYDELLRESILETDAVAYAVDAAVTALRETPGVSPQRWAPFVHIGA